MNKPTVYLVCSCSYSPGVDRWIASLSRIQAPWLKPVIIMFQPFFEVPDSFITRKYEMPYPRAVKRLFPVVDIVKNFGAHNWYLWTDCADVVFQTDIPYFIADPGGIHGYFSSEGMLHNEENFWHPFIGDALFGELRNRKIFNGGCYAMKGDFFCSFIYYMFPFLKEMNTFASVMDQLFLNKWILLNETVCADLDSICLNLHKRYQPDNPCSEAIVINNSFCNRAGEKYPIVHANGSNKQLLDMILF